MRVILIFISLFSCLGISAESSNYIYKQRGTGIHSYIHLASHNKSKEYLQTYADVSVQDIVRLDILESLQESRYHIGLSQYLLKNASTEIHSFVREHQIFIEYLIDTNGEIYDITFRCHVNKKLDISKVQGIFDKIVELLQCYKHPIGVDASLNSIICVYGLDKDKIQWTSIDLPRSFWRRED